MVPACLLAAISFMRSSLDTCSALTLKSLSLPEDSDPQLRIFDMVSDGHWETGKDKLGQWV